MSVPVDTIALAASQTFGDEEFVCNMILSDEGHRRPEGLNFGLRSRQRLAISSSKGLGGRQARSALRQFHRARFALNGKEGWIDGVRIDHLGRAIAYRFPQRDATTEVRAGDLRPGACRAWAIRRRLPPPRSSSASTATSWAIRSASSASPRPEPRPSGSCSLPVGASVGAPPDALKPLRIPRR